jgi:hypothetical protein
MQQKLSPCYFIGKKWLIYHPYSLMGTMLENSKSHKHLGVIFNSNGKWNNHINEIYTKACRRINILRMMKHRLDRKSLEKLYIGFIRPMLEYGGIVWDNCSLHESELLESTTRGSSHNYWLKEGNITCKSVHRIGMGATERTPKDK